MTVANPPVQSASPYKGLLARHPLSFFFLMAFAFTWIAWAPWYLSEDGVGLLPYKLGDTAPGLLNTAAILLGPTVSAFIMTATTQGRAGIRSLLRRIVLWRGGVCLGFFSFFRVPPLLGVWRMGLFSAGAGSVFFPRGWGLPGYFFNLFF